LDKDECREMGKKMGFTSLETENMIREMDLDGNGLISLEEWIHWCKNKYVSNKNYTPPVVKNYMLDKMVVKMDKLTILSEESSQKVHDSNIIDKTEEKNGLDLNEIFNIAMVTENKNNKS